MRLHRSPALLAVGAFAASLFIGLIPTAPAAAETVEEVVQLAAPSQTFTANPFAPQLATDRGEYTVTMLTVVQWPVPPSTPVSSGFGWRSAPCSWGCSSDHKGTDLTAGAGYPIQVIADGTVSNASCGGGLGCQVWVEHTIDGQHITSIYGHMVFGSLRVTAGQHIDRGTVVGLLGNTGASTGNHLHFEIHRNGVAIDSYAWIKATANDWMWQ